MVWMLQHRTLNVCSKTICYELDHFFVPRTVSGLSEECSPNNCLMCYKIAEMREKIVFYHSPRGVLIAVFPVGLGFKDEALEYLKESYGSFISSPKVVKYKEGSFLVFKWGGKNAKILFERDKSLIMVRTF